MFGGIGSVELLVVLVVALFVIGPERLPGAVRETAVWVRRIRHQINSLQRDLSDQIDEIQNEQMISDMRAGRRLLDEAKQDLTKSIEAPKDDEESAASEDRKS